MKKSILILVIYFICNNSYGFHKNQHYYRTYGNVKTYVQSSWKNYGSIVNIDIVGKLAEKLSKKLQYKDTIVIEFSQGSSKFYPELTIANKTSSNQVFLINAGLSSLYKKQKKLNRKRKKNNINIRLINNEANIWNILKLIEYSILNDFKSKKTSFKYSSDDESTFFKAYYLSLDKEVIKKIIDSKKSKILNDLFQEKINFIEVNGLEGFYQKGNYYFNNNKVSHSIDSLSYLVEFESALFIFKDNSSFVYLNENTESVINHELNSTENNPFYAEKYNYLENKKIENGIFLIRARSKIGYIFSEEKNEIIEVIDKTK